MTCRSEDASLVGQVVHLLAPRLDSRAYVRQVVDGRLLLAGDFRLAFYAKPSEVVLCGGSFTPARLILPYGWAIYRDGTKGLFSYDYLPLWTISPSGVVHPQPPWTAKRRNERCRVYVEDIIGRIWTSKAGQEWGQNVLAWHGIDEPPPLAGLMPFLVGNGGKLGAAVAAMRPAQRGGSL